MNITAYIRLMRFDKPIGVLLLWFPTAWALWLVNEGSPSWPLLLLFVTGTVLMRAAGCVINDIADRKIDKYVARTAQRPLTAGSISLFEALVILAVLLSAALMILLMLPRQCVFWALIALSVTFIYPFCKRFINAPQAVLGTAFSMSIPMAAVASQAHLDWRLALLVLLNFLWVVSYDTMYAMADRPDDLLIGVKSTAIYFADYDRHIVGLLQAVMHSLWLLLGMAYQMTGGFYLLWAAALLVLLYQQRLIYHRDPKNCFKAFLDNSYYGAIMWVAIITGLFY